MTAARRVHALPAVLAAIAMLFALVFRHDLIAWFSGASPRATPGEPMAAGPGSAGDTAYYTCAMHPQVHLDHPGQCPICSMPLVAVLRGDQAAGLIRVDEGRRAQLGIHTTRVIRAPLELAVRAEGRLVVDETRLHDVTLKVGGYVSGLRVNATGQRVARGDVLFTLYSPELYAAQQDYLNAREHRDMSHAGGAPGDNARGDALVQASETRLALWGLGADQLRAIAESHQPIERVAFRSPAAGVVIDKAVVEGDAVTAGQRLFRIADLDQIWVEADVHEADLARIPRGAPATVTLTYLPGKSFAGKVAFIYPYLDPMSRTGRVRIALANPQLELKPDMFATVTFALSLGERLQIPSSAVVYTGPRRVVFVDVGDGRLRPQDVTIGARTGDVVEVIGGLRAGDLVVTSGNFLIAAESRIRSAGGFWSEGSGGDHAAH
ncbi:MAG TPA: efflux RND transporter periplasmic adaptor subunit [Kofleriaceae bacterium]|jgi:Cu(I)/Ag(I) efflux system membrane fusion protein